MVNRTSKYVIAIAAVWIMQIYFASATIAQCSMCRAVVESDISGKGSGINNGIVYLMAFPYVLIVTLALGLFYKLRKDRAAEQVNP